MELAQCLTRLSTIFHSPFLELPGKEVQFLLQPKGRDILIKNYSSSYKESAVMFLIYPDKNGEATTLFIQRTEGYGVHSGQIALPGGAFEKEDTNIILTALRETEEEIGVSIESNNVFGSLTLLEVPVSGYIITPVIAYTEKTPVFKLDNIEVQKIIEISIDELLNTKVKHGEFETAFDTTITAPYYDIKGHRLWGATAMITAEFIALFK